MKYQGFAKKRDTNEPEIIAALVAVGATVEPLSATGVPDLLVGFRGANHLMEVKWKKGKLTPDQVDWHKAWVGSAIIVRNPEDALRALGLRIVSPGMYSWCRHPCCDGRDKRCCCAQGHEIGTYPRGKKS